MQCSSETARPGERGSGIESDSVCSGINVVDVCWQCMHSMRLRMNPAGARTASRRAAFPSRSWGGRDDGRTLEQVDDDRVVPRAVLLPLLVGRNIRGQALELGLALGRDGARRRWVDDEVQVLVHAVEERE